jgi:hypothetical protein
MEASPTTRMGWHEYYVDLFNKTDGKRGEHLANWFLLLHLAFDAQPIVESVKTPKSRRMQVANLMWHIILINRTTEYTKTTAKSLLEYKKTCKVSWRILGLPDDATKTLTALIG